MAKDLRDPIELGEKIKDTVPPKPIEDDRRISTCVFPHKKQAQPVKDFAEIKEEVGSIRAFILRVNRHGHHGLSALAIAQPQVNAEIPKRFFIDKELKVYYNVKILDKSEKIVSKEQCLSFPFRPKKKVTRFNKVTVEYWDEKDKKHTEEAEGLLAIVFQHETDHFNGVSIY